MHIHRICIVLCRLQHWACHTSLCTCEGRQAQCRTPTIHSTGIPAQRLPASSISKCIMPLLQASNLGCLSVTLVSAILLCPEKCMNWADQNNRPTVMLERLVLRLIEVHDMMSSMPAPSANLQQSCIFGMVPAHEMRLARLDGCQVMHTNAILLPSWHSPLHHGMMSNFLSMRNWALWANGLAFGVALPRKPFPIS